MRKILKILCVMLMLYIPTNIYASNIIYNDYQLATILSNETSMPILLVFSSESCGYCEKLKDDLPNLSDSLDSYIVCILDIHEYAEISKDMKVRNLPTSIVLDRGVEVSRKTGYGLQNYKEWLNKIGK
jgi:thioredoxin-like negative regulator of GroEL